MSDFLSEQLLSACTVTDLVAASFRQQGKRHVIETPEGEVVVYLWEDRIFVDEIRLRSIKPMPDEIGRLFQRKRAATLHLLLVDEALLRLELAVKTNTDATKFLKDHKL